MCGLKLNKTGIFISKISVTPCVGVWIETYVASYVNSLCAVTPCVGVWIETLAVNMLKLRYANVTPCVGVWIETLKSMIKL